MGERVLGAAFLDDREPHEIGGLEQAEVEDGRRDAEVIRDAPDDLALADAGRAFQ
jgi:hypothetical protein